MDTVDQSQLLSGSNVGIGRAHRPAQTFTVGRTGALAGIEVSVCSGNPTNALLTLTLKRTDGAVLATSARTYSTVETPSCASLSDSSVGAGLFKLDTCIPVIAGDKLMFELSISDDPAGPTAVLATNDANRYGGGILMTDGTLYNTVDTAFRTFVSP